MRDMLLDVVKHTGGLGFLNTVKVTGTEDQTLIEGMDDDKTVVLKAKLLSPEANLQGEFGMSRFNILKGYLDFPNYKTSAATLTVSRRQRKDVEVPEELHFNDGSGQKSVYRFMSADVVPDQARFLGKKWDVETQPSVSKIKEFASLAKILVSVEDHFLVKTTNKTLEFLIGDEDTTNDRTRIVIDSDVSGTLKGDLYWPIQQVLSILTLGLEENLKISFTTGAMQISMTSNHAEYSYLLPARRR